MSSLVLMWTWLEFRARRKWVGVFQSNRRLTLGMADSRLSWRVSSPGDLQVLREVFLDHEYALPPGWTPRTIIDLGSNIGVTVAAFKLRYPGASILALEPDPRAYELLTSNTATFPGLRTIQGAAGADDGNVVLYPSELTWASSTIRKSGLGSHSVASYALDTLLDAFAPLPVDVIKIDIEGAEWEVLASSTRLSEIRCIVGELHPAAIPVSSREFFDLLADFEVTTRAKGDDVLFTALRSDSKSAG